MLSRFSSILAFPSTVGPWTNLKARRRSSVSVLRIGTEPQDVAVGVFDLHFDAQGWFFGS